MATRVQFRRGTTTQHSTFTGAVGEVTVDTDKEVVVVHDGVQAGGYPVASAVMAQTFTKAQRGAIVALTDGATITPDFNLSNNWSLSIGGNRTLANPTNLTAGQSGVIYITQTSGSNALAFGSAWDFAGGTVPSLSTAAGAVDALAYAVRSTGSIAATLIKDVK